MIDIRENYDIRQMTTFGLEAVCGRLVQYDDPERDLTELRRRGLLDEFLMLGGGSNLLFVEGRYDGTVLHSHGRQIYSELQPSGEMEVRVSADTRLDSLCEWACQRGLWGLENLSGIPGTIGGATVQNAGAYGAEMADCLTAVEFYQPQTDEMMAMLVDKAQFGYRTSPYKTLMATEPLIITYVNLTLKHNCTPNLSYQGLRHTFEGTDMASITPTAVREAVIAMRQAKLPDPAVVGSAGSFFKNPVITPEEFANWNKCHPDEQMSGYPTPQGVKVSAARLIDMAGCKDFTEGGASLWPKQPLVIVNAIGTATGADVVRLERRIVEAVASKFGITLRPEVIHIYNAPKI